MVVDGLAQAVVQEVFSQQRAPSQALTRLQSAQVERQDLHQELHQMVETLSSIPLLR